ncbi:hypothetical protein CN918_27815 [Priestia megaterium]|nr:hypothetical protein CN918_27815 [Priestia megaterium]
MGLLRLSNMVKKGVRDMKILPISKIKHGMLLAQNIFRHDGLLAFAKGTEIKKIHIEAFQYLKLDAVMVYEEKVKFKDDDINFTLQILESAYEHTSIWTEEFGKDIFLKVSKRIIKNRRICKYLNQLRVVDSYSLAHCINISIVIGLILTNEGRADNELADITYLALLHDIGRIKMKGIFEKQGKLSEKEFEKIREHPELSFKLLKKAGFSTYDIRFVLETHEKYDGSGYPLQLGSTEISDLAQLIFIADTYNALSSYRPYRSVFHPFEVMQILESEIGKSFGEKYVEVFIDKFTPYRVGVMVEMSNGEVGRVKRNGGVNNTLPVIDILSKETGEKETTIDLRYHQELRITKILTEY